MNEDVKKVSMQCGAVKVRPKTEVRKMIRDLVAV